MSDQQLEKYYKIAITSLLFLFILFISSPLYAKGNAKIGGTFVNSDSATVKGALNLSFEQGNWQQSIETDYAYKKADDIETMNEFFLNTKANYTFAPRHYVFGVAQYDYDKFRTYGDRKVLGLGYGLKLLRTDRFKSSNEFSVAQLQTDLFSETIFRNSLWFKFVLNDAVDFTNKFLYEKGDASSVFIRNETALNYNFSNGAILSLNNTYTEDPVDNNVLSVTIGTKW